MLSPFASLGHPQKTVEDYIAGLASESDDLREASAYSLGHRGDPRAVESLIAALHDQDYAVRRNVAEALGKIGDPRAVEPLVAVLNRESRVLDSAAEAFVRDSAARALGRIGGDGFHALISTMDAEDWEARRAAAQGLAETRDPRAVEPLIAAFSDPITPVGHAAAYALGRHFGESAVGALISALRGTNSALRWGARRALVEIGASAGDSLVAISDEADEDTRILIGSALAGIALRQSWETESPSAGVVTRLARALQERDLPLVRGAYTFFIKKGIFGCEPVLASALEAYGDEALATTFLNSGNSELERAARAWAARNNLGVFGRVGTPLVTWGSDP